MFEFDQHFRETEYAWLQYLDDNGYLVPSVNEPDTCWCLVPVPILFSEQVGYWLCNCGKFIVRIVDKDAQP